MKRFISFAEETTPEKVEDLSQYSHHMTVPEHGAHSKPKKEDELHGPVHSSEDEEDLSQYSHSMSVPEHGQHSKLKEDASHVPDKHINEWIDRNENDHLGNNPEEIGEHLHKIHDFHSTPQNHAIKKYTSYSRDLNQYLVNRFNQQKEPPKDSYDEEKLNKHFERHAENLDTALHHHKNPFYLDTFHGASFHPGKLAAEHPNNRIYFPSFVSTSTSKRKASSFGSLFNSKGDKESYGGNDRHMIHFHLEPGHKGMYIGDHSEFPEEKELLLPRGFSAHIHPTPDKFANEYGGTTHIWHARDIQQPKPKPRKLTPEEKQLEDMRKKDPIAADIHELSPQDSPAKIMSNSHKMQDHHWDALFDKYKNSDSSLEEIADDQHAPKKIIQHVLNDPEKYYWASQMAAQHPSLDEKDIDRYIKSAPDKVKLNLLSNPNSKMKHFEDALNSAENQHAREKIMNKAKNRFKPFTPEYHKFREFAMNHPEHGKENSRSLQNLEYYDKLDYPSEYDAAVANGRDYKYTHMN